ncbi:hypothetical protein N7U66_18835 [Lacinutrix neustonica]|uniref:Uncharacterized protein n=1 Tax=Lacinutrix neustonica TaxID=2980107 RepID=A0A9E8MX45_9FLAO|nr:hypothetical protein [Lacinutrix neustonica]WAC01890.1 hypothetical protein N7U66_18835 [Lacinutrix neustonica]
MAYDATYVVYGASGYGVMYRLLNHKQSFFASQNTLIINGNIPASIPTTEIPMGAGLYYYLHDQDSNRWFEYGLPVEVAVNTSCLSCSLENMWQAFVSESLFIAGRYFLPVEDVVILITGEDFDGVQSSRAVAAGFILVDLIPGATAIKAIKLVKYGDEALELATVAIRYIDNIYREQTIIIENVLNGIELLTNNTRRGNFGEIVVDVDIYEKGYESLNRTPGITNLNDTAIHSNGIDNIIRNP